MPELKPYRGDYYLWEYVPSPAAGGIFTALFILGTAYVTWRMFKSRTWFCTVFIIGGLFEAIGYAARAAAENKTDQLLPYVLQSTLILVAPALFAASVYMVLGRLIRSLGAGRLSVIPVRWLTLTFVCGDVFSFLMQASGAGLMATGNSMDTGENVIVAGLVIQIVIFGIFATTSTIFHFRIRSNPTKQSLDRSPDWQRTMVMLYTVSVLIMVRSIIRLVEYIMGHDGYLLRNEWTLYVFDGVPMFVVVVMFSWIFPSGLHPVETSSYHELAHRAGHEDGVLARGV